MKNLKQYLTGFCVAAMTATMATSCNDWLKEEAPGTITLTDFFTSGSVAIQTVNGCYTPLAWEYNQTYFSEWYFGDIPSDDALKGGEKLADGPDAYDIDNFKVNPYNSICLNYYRAKYIGIARCNLAIQEIAKMEPDEEMSQERKNCLLGEAYYLRAFYYFQLVRIFGGVPLVDFVIDSADRWQQPRATADAVYAHIISDLINAEKLLWDKDKYDATDLGRATKGAAQAMLCKVYLYIKDYNNAYEWGKKFVTDQYLTGKYSLLQNYSENFTLAGENGPESVFEIQYAEEEAGDYGDGFGFTRGTFTTILVRSRASTFKTPTKDASGWGWNHPTQNLYDEFEQGDPRRDATIGKPDDNACMEAGVNYLGNPYYNIKYAFAENGTFPALAHHARGPLNYRLIRVSDVLLLYAEAALESGKDLSQAKWALEEVRARARANSADKDVLPKFPNYNGYTDSPASLRDAIRHERRVELAMEGHRWFDLVRWGIAYEVMDKDNGSYGRTETPEARAEMASFVRGKHELFPIPAEEINLNPMEQNPNY